MDFNIVHPINWNKNESQNFVMHNLNASPLGGIQGQIYFNTATGEKKPYYHNGTAFVPFEGADNYVISAVFSSINGDLVLGRSGGLTNVVANLDGRYQTENATITLSGDIGGAGKTSITTTINATAITSKSDAGLVGGFPTGTNYMLISQDGALKKYSLGDLKTYISTSITNSGQVTAFTQASSAITGGVQVVSTLNTGSASYTPSFSLLGTANQITVENTSGSVTTLKFPNAVVMPGSLTVTGNLTVNGTVTTINTEQIDLADNIIQLNSNYVGSTPTENAGIEINRGTLGKAGLIWDEAADRWTFSNDGTTYYTIPLPGEYNNYYPTTQTAFNLTNASGLSFIKSLTTNSLGQVTGATESLIQDGNTTQKGVVEVADNAEHLAGTSTTLVASPGGVAAMIAASITNRKYITNITPTNGATTDIDHNLGTEDVHVTILNTATKEMVMAPWKVVTGNKIQVAVGLNPIGQLTVKVFS